MRTRVPFVSHCYREEKEGKPVHSIPVTNAKRPLLQGRLRVCSPFGMCTYVSWKSTDLISFSFIVAQIRSLPSLILELSDFCFWNYKKGYCSFLLKQNCVYTKYIIRFDWLSARNYLFSHNITIHLWEIEIWRNEKMLLVLKKNMIRLFLINYAFFEDLILLPTYLFN